MPSSVHFRLGLPHVPQAEGDGREHTQQASGARGHTPGRCQQADQVYTQNYGRNVLIPKLCCMEDSLESVNKELAKVSA